jgi:hypothetical protein
MDWKLIFLLSLFGLAMAFATVFLIPPNIEPWLWLVVLLICAYLIAARRRDKLFLHGLCVGLLNCVWVTSAHVLFAATYLANHAQEAAMMKSMPMPASPRLMMTMMGPVAGVISGVVLGAFAWIAGRFVKPAAG